MHPSASLINGSQDGDLAHHKPTLHEAIRTFVSEFLGTGLLVYATCLGCTIEVGPSLLQRSLTSGLSVATVIQIFGHLSGAHVNPAITLCAFIMKQTPVTLVPVYVCAQILGCICGYGLVVVLTPDKYLGGSPGQCATLPHDELSLLQACAVEILASFVLAMAVCPTWDPGNGTRSDGVPLKVGFVVVLLNLSAGSYTSASMNPSRSLGPAVWNGDWRGHWIYWVGPGVGAALSGLLYRTLYLNKN